MRRGLKTQRARNSVKLGVPFKHFFFVVIVSMKGTFENIFFWCRKAHPGKRRERCKRQENKVRDEVACICYVNVKKPGDQEGLERLPFQRDARGRIRKALRGLHLLRGKYASA